MIIMAKTTVEFSDIAADELAQLADRLSTTKADVLRNALSLYAFLFEKMSQKGRQLGIVEGDHDVKMIVAVPGLRVARTAAFAETGQSER